MSLVENTAHTKPKKYRVYKTKDSTALPDPDMPQPRYHTYIFVETETSGSGYVHQVTGDLVAGMRYEAKFAERPEDSEAFHSKDFLGAVSSLAYPSSIDKICRAQPPPGRRKAVNIRSGRTEPVKIDGTFYAPGETRPQLFKCTEWTEQLAIPALIEANVLDINEDAQIRSTSPNHEARNI